jgi:hypothetical protein
VRELVLPFASVCGINAHRAACEQRLSTRCMLRAPHMRTSRSPKDVSLPQVGGGHVFT